MPPTSTPPIETVRVYKDIPIADAEGTAIRVGSVLREVMDGERGVVIQIARSGEYCSTPAVMHGDLLIKTGLGTTRVTNRYGSWKHIPHNEQTYQERLTSWMHRPYEHEECRRISGDEGLAIDGIIALLPDDTVNWEFGPWPDDIESALKFLVEHMTEVAQRSEGKADEN